VIVGTLSKALGSYGGYVCTRHEIAQLLVNRSRPLIFSTAPPPPAVAGALAALEILLEQPGLPQRLQELSAHMRRELARSGVPTPAGRTQIVPVIVGDAGAAVALGEAVLARGVFAQAIRPPTVPEGGSRLRLAVMASHTPEELSAAARTIATDTGVGKTILCAALAASLRARGMEVHARKPVLTGLDEHGPADHELLALGSGEHPEEIAPLRYGPPLSPHLAAELAGRPIDVPALARTLRLPGTVIVEGIGGLLVPLGPGWDVRALARELALGVLVAARPGLGTINHTLLTLEAARAAGLDVRAVVLTPWPAEAGVLERSNRETIESLGEVEVATLGPIDPLSPRTLAAAGDALAYERWLA
jgi:dethiobiotin synthetase